jgi:CBS domain containing-hemolysin-like protein
MAAARIRIQLLDGETVVHEFQRATTLHQHDSLKKLVREALGWMQSYGDQTSIEQWEMDVRRVNGHKPG